ncbi:hypothetical protein FACS1894201_06650 [Bacteroidia bacterium]|nr:hypothetical protein FACS1894201_06650 [Bacteroidia bacterium]
MNKMKKIIYFVALCLLVMQAVQAQEPRPEWVRNYPPIPIGANFIYAYGMGIGSDEDAAIEKAWVDAIKTALHENGHIAIGQQKLDGVHTKHDLDAYIPTTVLPRRRVCQTPPIYGSDGKAKVYILLQVSSNGQRIDAHNANIECETAAFMQKLETWNKAEVERQKRERDANIAKELAAQKERDKKNTFNYKSGNYWGVSFGNGLFHGKIIGGDLSTRWGIGDNAGWGLRAGLGLAGSYDAYLHYSFGAKFYPYKTFYLSANYGTVTATLVKSTTAYGDDSYNVFNGFTFMSGFDIRSEVDWGKSFLIPIGFGCSLTGEGKWFFAWTIGFGAALPF